MSVSNLFKLFDVHYFVYSRLEGDVWDNASRIK